MMAVPGPLNDYLTLLKIRQAGRRREAAFLGGLFLVSILATIALGLLDQISGRSVFLTTAILVAIGFGSMAAWVRLEIVSGTIELLNNLQRTIGENS
jgi:hypothetical protein